MPTEATPKAAAAIDDQKNRFFIKLWGWWSRREFAGSKAARDESLDESLTFEPDFRQA